MSDGTPRKRKRQDDDDSGAGEEKEAKKSKTMVLVLLTFEFVSPVQGNDDIDITSSVSGNWTTCIAQGTSIVEFAKSDEAQKLLREAQQIVWNQWKQARKSDIETFQREMGLESDKEIKSGKVDGDRRIVRYLGASFSEFTEPNLAVAAKDLDNWSVGYSTASKGELVQAIPCPEFRINGSVPVHLLLSQAVSWKRSKDTDDDDE